MENQNINQQFREDEIANIRRWDKERNEYITNPFPKIGGRLRLAHEANEALSIETDIIRYDEQIAVVSAVSKTNKGCFRGIGMASVQRDEKIAPAILELAETRAIARCLRFAGYGVEYCSAEEVSHLNGNGDEGGGNGHHARQHQNDNLPPANGNRNGSNASGSNGGNGNGNGGNGSGGSSSGSNNGNGNSRLSAKQYRYIQKLNEDMGRASSELDKQCLAMFGTVAQHLSKGDASAMIEHLLSQ